MKTIRTLSLLVLFAASATIVVAQTGASASPNAQPTSSAQSTPVTPPSSEKQSLPEQDRQKVEAELNDLFQKYRSKGNWYLAAYYILVIGAALASVTSSTSI